MKNIYLKYVIAIVIFVVYLLGSFLLFKLYDYMSKQSFEDVMFTNLFGSFNSFLMMILIIGFVLISFVVIFSIVNIFRTSNKNK